jgi:hypothetical protein
MKMSREISWNEKEISIKVYRWGKQRRPDIHEQKSLVEVHK